MIQSFFHGRIFHISDNHYSDYNRMPNNKVENLLVVLLLLTLSAHAREGYSSHFVSLSVSLSVCHFSILEKAPISGLKLTSVYILGDDLSPLNVALF